MRFPTMPRLSAARSHCAHRFVLPAAVLLVIAVSWAGAESTVAQTVEPPTGRVPAPSDASAPSTAPSTTPGPVVAVGGGRVPEEVRARILALAGGPDAPLLVVPWASRREEAGSGAATAWREAGATDVTVIERDTDKAREQLAAARVIWFGGGDQSRLMDTLRELDLLRTVRERHRAGAVLSGSSAGAAVLSARMLTGDADLEAVRAGTTELVEGLGVVPGLILDQHFLARRRNNRLLGAVLDHPTEVGVGIDESTAIVLREGALEVIGSGQVVLYDARRAEREETGTGDAHAARGLALHILRAGSPPWRLAPAPDPAPEESDR